MTVIATGGVASLFDGASRSIDHFDPDITIQGLYEVWKLNSGGDR
jgi:type III pantothenate kinase